MADAFAITAGTEFIYGVNMFAYLWKNKKNTKIK